MSTLYGYSASLVRGCAGLTDIASLPWRYRPNVWVQSKRAAVQLIIAANMDAAESYGHGNAAKRRMRK